VAHDNKKSDLLDWVRFNRAILLKHDLFATGTTGGLLEEELGISVAWNTPVACNRSSADFMISSPLMSERYEQQLPDYEEYRARLEQSVTA
jgi:methylglyoxal synthase